MHQKDVLNSTYCNLQDLYSNVIFYSLAENQWVMSALYSFMLDRVTAGDLDSSLITSILKVCT
jgi:hypothetical protein